MARGIVAHDWSTTLGPLEAWPQSLKTAVGLLIHSPVPIVLLWGPGGIMIYNDAYSVFAGARHPQLLGSKVREGWPEVADFNDHVMKVGLAGGTLSYQDQELTLHRSGKPEQVWMNLDYSPVFDESGIPGGVIAIVVETSPRVRAERRSAALVELGDRIRDIADPDMLAYAGAEVLGRALGVSRAGYGIIDKQKETITIERDWNAPGVQSLAGVLHFRDYGSYIEELKRGETVIFSDADTDPRTKGHAQALKDISAQSLVNMPLREDGGLVALLYLNNATARDWPAEEISFIREAAERIRTAAERRRAEAELRDNEARLRFLDALGKETARSLDAGSILATTTRMVGEYLNVSSCAYADMDADEDGFTIRGGWSAPGSPSIVGHYSLADFGPLAAGRLGAGLPLIINDAAAQLAAPEAASFQALGISATICMPLVKEGRLTALMAIHDKAPRVWTANEQSVIGEVTERSWAHIERAQAVAVVRASENQFRTMAQAMPNHVWTASPDGLLDWFNSQVYAYTGAVPGSLDGVGWVDIVHPEDIEAAAGAWSSALAAGESYETEFRLRRADGKYRWHIARAVPVRNTTGEIARWIGTNTDIEDQKQAVTALRELNAELERKVIERAQARGLTWQVSPDLMGALNSQGYFETFNPAWKTMLGWSEEEVASLSIFELLHPDDVERTKAGFALTQQGQPAIQFPNRYRCKDGSYRWISWVGVPEDGMVYCSGRDITEQKEKEAQLAQTEDALRQAQKMEAVGQLTGGIAHDFNNLLQGITGALDRVQHRIAQGRISDVDRFLKAAVESANRATALTHRLLAFSRRQTLDPRPLDANRLIGSMEDLIRRTVGPNVAVEVVGAGGLWPIRVDPSQLENSLLNLCINARDAMPDGGKLTIETANKWLDERSARERELPPGQYVSLCVTDTGTGMAPDVIARAFDPFFTTKPLGQGTGLGLSMIYGFVRQSGGQVRIYSELEQGTTMCLYFPRHLGQVDDEPVPVDEPVEQGFGETVLVVDDEAFVRILITEVLAESHYNVLEAGDGASALKILESDKRIDLLVTDVGLPGGMNGRQVADAARVLRKDLKVLFITGYAENAVVGNGQLAPGMQILAKPFAMTSLANKVREMLES